VSRILDVADPQSLVLAAEAAAAGGLVVVPTDTVYGIAARVDRPEGLAALFEAKSRPRSSALPVLVAGADQAASLGVFSPPAGALARAFWPGPLTIVVPLRAGFDVDLGGDGRTVGLRTPAHPFLLELLALTGPLATTSANRSGEPTPRMVAEIVEVFGEVVDVYLDGGPSSGGPPSSVVSVGEASPALLRAGAIPFDDIIRIALVS
jgi:L-threonylcarbamoyladenylate synthase